MRERQRQQYRRRRYGTQDAQKELSLNHNLMEKHQRQYRRQRRRRHERSDAMDALLFVQ